MLKTGAHTYTETLYSSQDLLTKLHSKSVKGSIFEAGACTVLREEESMPLRMIESMVTNAVFRVLMYCTLTGVDVSKILDLNLNPLYSCTIMYYKASNSLQGKDIISR